MMRRFHRVGWAVLLLLLVPPAAGQVDFGSLLDEMSDLPRLARWPSAAGRTARRTPAYRTIQFSSYDRRSFSPDAPGWFENADGFGREPVPGFASVIRKPDKDGRGRYLVCEVNGPGAIVRGWSAGMGGVLRVYLDGRDHPIWDGSGYEFLARRSRHYFERAGLKLDTKDAFVQEDADYLPIPFAQKLRVTWEGRLKDLHFYHLQVRVYRRGTRVKTFDPEADPREQHQRVERAVRRLTRPAAPRGKDVAIWSDTLEPKLTVNWAPKIAGPAAIEVLALTVRAHDLETALRRTRLRIRFDHAAAPQVESPLGDLFASGPGVNPFASLPITVEPIPNRERDEVPAVRLTCRFVMPFRQSVSIEFTNFGNRPFSVDGRLVSGAWSWDGDSMYFRARWRVDHGLTAGGRGHVVDLPFLVAIGRGALVGVASILVNPSPVPTPGGNWWGEGDEKIFVDGAPVPAAFGTGSEDYYNYAWSRPELFAHPYCGQPLTSGPGTAGYVSNHRFQIMERIPFARSIAVYLELYHHGITPGLSYGRIVYYYAAPGALDDHRALSPAEMIVPELPAQEPVARGGASNAVFHHLEDLKPEASGGRLQVAAMRLASRKRVVAWDADAGDRLSVKFSVDREGTYNVNLVAVRAPGAGAFKAWIGREAVASRQGDVADLATDHVTRLVNVRLRSVPLKKGAHRLTLECTRAGRLAFDYAWIRYSRGMPVRVKGALEAEEARIVGQSSDLRYLKQGWGKPIFSGDRQVFVEAVRPEQYIELEFLNPDPGRRKVRLGLTRSWDYGILDIRLDGREAASEVDTYIQGRELGRKVLDLGVHDMGRTIRLRITVVGTNPKSEPPHYYFGVDYLLLSRVD